MAKTPVEKELERIERKILFIYGDAGKDLQKKARKYFARYAEIDEKKKALVEAGELSASDYAYWRRGQMLSGKHWSDMQQQAAKILVEADKKAVEVVNNALPSIYTLSYNDVSNGLSAGVKGYSFELVDENTIRNLAKTNKTLLPYKIVDGKKSERWHTGRVNAQVTQGILQGESIPQIAKRMRENLAMTASGSAVRNARTTVTSAESKGRMDMLDDAEEKGVVVHKVWIATHDSRTRHAHLMLDGQEREKDEPFTSELGDIMYPADPDADPANTYNCRCSLGYKVVSVLGRKVEQPKVYEPEVTEPEQPIVEHHIAQGKDISETWKRRADEFDFEIEDVINAQGFDGVPQVVSPEEFDKAVKESNFIAQRTYSAPDQETLDAYRDQLYHGKWYVDCSTGGAQYGQGMYCAADYTGTLSDGIKIEMEHYREIGEGRTYTAEKYELFKKKAADDILKNLSEEEQAVIHREILRDATEDVRKIAKQLERNNEEKYELIYKKYAYIAEEVDKKARSLMSPSYTETLTLAKDAKVITYDDILRKKSEEIIAIRAKARDSIGHEMIDAMMLKEDERNYVLWGLNIDEKLEPFNLDKAQAFSKTLSKEAKDEYKDLRRRIENAINKEIDERGAVKLSDMDVGAYAAQKGYDAINAANHGESGSYTVILNRTKVIFKGE